MGEQRTPARHRDGPPGCQGPSGRGAPLSNRTPDPGLGGAPPSPALVSSSTSPPVLGGVRSGFTWPRVCPAHNTHQTQETLRKKASRSPQTPPRGVRGSRRRNGRQSLRSLGARDHVGSRGSQAGSASLGPSLFRHLPAPLSSLLLGRTDKMPCVRTWCGAQSQAPERTPPFPPAPCTQLHPHFSVGSLKCPSSHGQPSVPDMKQVARRRSTAGPRGHISQGKGRCPPAALRTGRPW